MPVVAAIGADNLHSSVATGYSSAEHRRSEREGGRVGRGERPLMKRKIEPGPDCRQGRAFLHHRNS